MKSVLWLSCLGPQRINPLLIITTLLLETLLKSAYNQICNHDIKIQEECFDSKVVTGCDDIVAGCLNTNELLGPDSISPWIRCDIWNGVWFKLEPQTPPKSFLPLMKYTLSIIYESIQNEKYSLWNYLLTFSMLEMSPENLIFHLGLQPFVSGPA